MGVRVTGYDKLSHNAQGNLVGVLTVHLPSHSPAKGVQIKVPVSTVNGRDGARLQALYKAEEIAKTWLGQVSMELAKQ